jgi:DNA-binding SARP family transcriptional activator
MKVSIRLLGGFEVVVDGRPIPARSWRRRAAAALVKLLALQDTRRLHREQVIDALWPDLLLDEATPRLHKAAHYARTVLGRRDSVVLSGQMVTLFPEAEITVDVAEFGRAAHAALDQRELSAADDAIDRYHGELLPDDVYEPWTEQPRDRLRLRYLELLRICGRWRDLLLVDPLDAQAQLMLVEEHVQAGRRQAALRQLDTMDEVFRRELGTDAGAGAAALRQRVLAMPVEQHDAEPILRRATPVPRPTTPTVGRDHDMERIRRLLERSRIVTLLGPGGVGKTRLGIEVALRWITAMSVDSCFVDLTKISDPALVAELIGTEIGVAATLRPTCRPRPAAATNGQSFSGRSS